MNDEVGQTETCFPANRPARLSAYTAAGGVALLMSFLTFYGWMFPQLTLTGAVVCGLLAVVTGHVGRLRRRRHERGTALLGIIGGWLVLLTCAALTTVVIAVFGGLAAVLDGP
ncbi:hypothetical protein [Streptomyces sp. NBC_00503]|uniref:hypothetical protein n=1 Tax=Streptomyces sp. NBC_00503 TaxID=2903659 RepID=UPI002E80EE33|nr:hypothetical protein [Streptomyces sp. NBC_00503]WUD85344.1 hypothetical protein OG490_34925 [Streptomyces sp. NBC_00503]